MTKEVRSLNSLGKKDEQEVLLDIYHLGTVGLMGFYLCAILRQQEKKYAFPLYTKSINISEGFWSASCLYYNLLLNID